MSHLSEDGHVGINKAAVMWTFRAPRHWKSCTGWVCGTGGTEPLIPLEGILKSDSSTALSISTVTLPTAPYPYVPAHLGILKDRSDTLNSLVVEV